MFIHPDFCTCTKYTHSNIYGHDIHSYVDYFSHNIKLRSKLYALVNLWAFWCHLGCSLSLLPYGCWEHPSGYISAQFSSFGSSWENWEEQMELQLDLKAWRVDRICICRARRRTFQGGKNNMNINAKVGIVCMSTVSKEARGKDL